MSFLCLQVQDEIFFGLERIGIDYKDLRCNRHSKFFFSCLSQFCMCHAKIRLGFYPKLFFFYVQVGLFFALIVNLY